MAEVSEAGAPGWYIDHFVPFGHTPADLRRIWARLPGDVREGYRQALTATHPTASAGLAGTEGESDG